MSSEQREAILKRHEGHLWWMSEKDRAEFMRELRADYREYDIFEDVQECVAAEMAA